MIDCDPKKDIIGKSFNFVKELCVVIVLFVVSDSCVQKQEIKTTTKRMMPPWCAGVA